MDDWTVWGNKLPTWEVFEASESFDFWHVLSNVTTQEEDKVINKKIINPWTNPLFDYYRSARRAVYDWLAEDPKHVERAFRAIKIKQKVGD